MAETPIKEDDMNKKVIYTCLVGNYDVLRQPLAIDESYDYICFSNDIKEERVGVWQIRPIPFKHKDKARLSRYVKILPHRALEDYEWSLWMDANIQITKKEFYSIVRKRAEEYVESINRIDLTSVVEKKVKEILERKLGR